MKRPLFHSIILSLAVLICTVVTTAQASESFTGKCLLQIKNKKYLDGTCPVIMEDDGNFTIGASETTSLTYFAMVSLTDKNTADGFWNEDEGANHAQTPLGKLTRKGACWQNKTAKVCAWK
jgi:hypothetical protein